MASTTLTRPPQETTLRRKERCDRCRYWSVPTTAMDDKAMSDYGKAIILRQREAERGICHRYPPTYRSQFPVTLATDWCGEYRD
ncbi:MAG: hypothetical protein JNL04_01440 [Rhodospirillaceae bacterium]|nr:hypothetical protein [Rhodospirillaceae bacterium]